MQRRQFVKFVAAGLSVWHIPDVIIAGNNASASKKLIWVILRGGMDALDTIIPTFEKSLRSYRPSTFISNTESLLSLDSGFAFHPSLSRLHQLYSEGQLAPIVAVGSGYRERSHFAAQDYLESGLPQSDPDSGWLARAIDRQNYSALSIANAIPVSLRSSASVSTWYPSKLKPATDEIYRQLKVLYQEDELLTARLAEGQDLRTMSGMVPSAKRRHNFSDLCQSCAKLMTETEAFNCATLELGGWDTHHNQKQRLSRNLKQLDDGLFILKQGLGDRWKDCVIVCATEFGRTVKENGTAGTDHGTASAMLVMGGAVNGGKVLGKWPGLAAQDLHEFRDLRPTSNSFAWLATILRQHWCVDEQTIATIFPAISSYNTRLII